jgi:hypothetical protein
VKRIVPYEKQQYGTNWNVVSVAVRLHHGWQTHQNVPRAWRHSVNKYDSGNSWNRDSDSWFKDVWQKLASVACLLLIVGYVIVSMVLL